MHAARLRPALPGHPGKNGGPVAPTRRRGVTEWHKAPPCASERSSDVIRLGFGIRGDGALVTSELPSDGQGGALSHWNPNHSYRSATMGSILVARRAGM